MTLVRWDPFRELEEVSDRLNRGCLLAGLSGAPMGRNHDRGGLVTVGRYQ